MRRRPSTPVRTGIVLGSALAFAGCGMLPSSPPPVPSATHAPAISAQAQDVVLFALGLVETGYRFGGKNPDAGLDCSGMVSYVFDKAANVRLTGSAADIAKLGRPIDPASLKPGDLVFFNTRNKPYSHVGIYIGDGRFVHAPSSGGKVRTESLRSGWFAARFEEARSYIE
ncbi:MAG TPA: C40 family peptidase [Rhodocyclaceae bacterium]